MTPTEVLKMLKSKIDTAGLNKCNYVIETSDIEAINQALLLYYVLEQSKQLECDCQSPETGHYSNFCPIHNERPYDPELVLYNIERQSEQLACEHNYQPDTTCGVDITCCKKCGDII